MANLKDYLEISACATSIKKSFTEPIPFSEEYSSLFDIEKNAFLRHYIINNQPLLFKDRPLLFEQLTQYIADITGSHACEVKLIGSGKTGFSISPPPGYGTQFSENSDLDFVLINEEVFHQLENEFSIWEIQYRAGKIMPSTPEEEKYWPQNADVCPSTLKRGFIDTNKIPSYPKFVRTQSINQSLYLIKRGLAEVHKIKIKKASMRVYKNWKAFSKQLKINTEYVLNQL